MVDEVSYRLRLLISLLFEQIDLLLSAKTTITH